MTTLISPGSEMSLKSSRIIFTLSDTALKKLKHLDFKLPEKQLQQASEPHAAGC